MSGLMVDDHDPWGVFVKDMLRMFGGRENECVWCGKTVYMALQGFYSGGIWTTEEADEGPCSSGLSGPGTRCDHSSDGEHSCFATSAWFTKASEDDNTFPF